MKQDVRRILTNKLSTLQVRGALSYKYINTLKQAFAPSQFTTKYPKKYLRVEPTKQSKNVGQISKLPGIIKYLHAAAFIPVLSMWIESIKMGSFQSCPGLTAEVVKNAYPRVKQQQWGAYTKTGITKVKSKPPKIQVKKRSVYQRHLNHPIDPTQQLHTSFLKPYKKHDVSTLTKQAGFQSIQEKLTNTPAYYISMVPI